LFTIQLDLDHMKALDHIEVVVLGDYGHVLGQAGGDDP
jgi:hypothetical protein